MEKEKKIRKNFGHFVSDIKDPKTEKGNYIISTLGYQSTEEKIKAMTMAGINLAMIRGSFQSDVQDLQEKIDEMQPDNLANSRRMDIQEKLDIARQTKEKLGKYKANLDAEQKKAMRERTEYLERMTTEYEQLLSKQAKNDAKKPNLEE